MYYLNSRYYDPATGRFLNADIYVSTGQGLGGYNMYAYCSGNPVIHTRGHSKGYNKLWEEFIESGETLSYNDILKKADIFMEKCLSIK